MTSPATENQYASAADFKKKSQRAVEFNVPSGFKVLVRRPGISELMSQGLFPDSLMGIVSAMIDQGQGNAGRKRPSDRKKSAEALQKEQDAKMEKAMAEIASDIGKLQDLMVAVDKAAVYCLIQPKVVTNLYPEDHEKAGKIIDEEDRDEELLYVDEVSEDDKMAIFNFAVGGDGEMDTSLAGFPVQPEQGVGTVPDVEDVGVSSK